MVTKARPIQNQNPRFRHNSKHSESLDGVWHQERCQNLEARSLLKTYSQDAYDVPVEGQHYLPNRVLPFRLTSLAPVSFS